LIDCYLENCPKSALFGVFDGHGGPEVSRYLGKNIPQVFNHLARFFVTLTLRIKREEKLFLNNHLTLQIIN
jgi:serine/threonine protein phosphatase PrpC